MATTTFQPYTGNGSNKTFNYSFPTFTVSEVVVEVDGVVVDNFTIPGYQTTGTRTVTFDNTTGTLNSNVCEADGAPKNNLEVIIRRDTNVDVAKATYTAGASLKAESLTNNNTQILRALQEEQNTPITTPRLRDGQVTSAKIKDGTIQTADIAGDQITNALIADDQVDSEHYVDLSIDTQHIANLNVTTAKLDNDAVTASKLADDAVVTDNIVNLNVTRGKIANDAIDGTKIDDDAVDSEHIAADSLDTEHYAPNSVDATAIGPNAVTTVKILNDAVTIDKIADAAIITNSEQSNHTGNDNTFFTTAASDARYFNISSGETIKDGDAFPDNDTTIATTAAINDRIIDIVNDVGGFDIIESEQHFPNTNPQGQAGSAAVLSIKAASGALTPSGTTLTIVNGNLANNANITITGVTSTIPSGFGFIVESTSTLHSYTFHRLVPKATEVTTVAGISGNVTTVANNNANVTTVATNIANVNTTAGAIANVNTTATNIANVNTVATNIANVNTTAGSIANVNTTAGAIANVNTTATNIASVNNASANINSINNFGDTYQVHSNNPTTDGGGNALAAGDLYFDTSANELKVYNGSAWQGGVTATGNFAVVTGNTFTGDNRYNDGVKLKLGTGSDLEIYHTGSFTKIDNKTGDLNIFAANGGKIALYDYSGTETLAKLTPNGAVELYYDNSKKLETNTSGIGVTGNITVSGNVDGRDLAADGSKLDTYEANGSSYLRSDAADIKTSGDLTFYDNVKAKFGTGNDLQVYHDGTNSLIRNSTGNLYYGGSTHQFLNYGLAETMAKFVEDGAVELYYDNAKKIETTATGVNITGVTVDDGATHDGDVTFTGSNGNVVFDKSDNSLKFSDATGIKIGDGTDLHIYHGGSGLANATFIDENGSGRLRIRTNDYVEIGKIASAEISARFFADGAAELYYDNSKNLETTSSGVTVTGQLSVTDTISTAGNLDMSDSTSTGNNRIRLGASDDLEIYHDGSHSRIVDGGTGVLSLQSNDLRVHNPDASKFMAKFVEDGAVELYHANSKKFETTSGGATVTGTLTTTSGINAGSNISVADNVQIKVGTGDDLKIFHDGTHTRVHNTGGNLDFRAQSYRFNNSTGTENCLDIDQNGAVVLYYDHNQKLATSAGGVNVTGELNVTTKVAYPDNAKAIFGTGDDFQIYHDSTNSNIHNATGSLFLRSDTLKLRNGNGNEDFIECFDNGAVRLYYDNSLKLATTGSGVNVTGSVTATSFVGSGAGLTGIAAMPAGAVIPFAMDAAPSGYLECSGAAVSRSTYSALFSAIGTTYGAGDGSSTFNLPNLRGEFIRGLDNGRGVDSNRAMGSFQDHGIPAMKGHISDAHGQSRLQTFAQSGFTNVFDGVGTSSWRTSIHAVSGNYASIMFDSTNVIPAADHVRPRNVAMMYCIKT